MLFKTDTKRIQGHDTEGRQLLHEVKHEGLGAGGVKVCCPETLDFLQY